jgi:hypothetical protein
MICSPLSGQLLPDSTVPSTDPACIKSPRLKGRREHLIWTL